MERQITLSNGFVIEIYRDEYADCPFDFCEGHLWDWISNYRDWEDRKENNYRPSDEVLEMFFNRRAKEGASEFETKDYIMTAIYAYIHGGATISLSPFYCPWDSGIAYVAYMDKNAYRREFGRWNKKKAMQMLEWRVKEMDEWMQGETYGFELRDKKGDWIDGCGGFYGEDSLWNYLKENVAYIDAEEIEKFR